MGGFVNWILVILGGLLILMEILLGAASGFDFFLIGSAVLLGGILGLVTQSPELGVATAGLLSVVYVLFGRRRVKAKLRQQDVPTNTDLLLGKSARVTERIAPDQPGRVQFEGDEWRAVLDRAAGSALEKGEDATILRIEGVTLIVAPATRQAPHGVST